MYTEMSNRPSAFLLMEMSLQPFNFYVQKYFFQENIFQSFAANEKILICLQIREKKIKLQLTQLILHWFYVR